MLALLALQRLYDIFKVSFDICQFLGTKIYSRQAPQSWCMSNENFQTNGRDKLRLKIFEYSVSREYTIQPDIVEYDKNHMTKPGFDLIIGCNTM